MHGITGSGAIAPDTTGLNFYRADPSLSDLLQLYLPDALFRHIEPHLDRLGALAGDQLDQCARLADRHTPVLHHRDRFGRDRQWIEYHPAYRELERVAYGEFGIHAMSHRKGILGWPTPIHPPPSTPSRICSTRPNSAWGVRSTSPTAPRCCCRASATRPSRTNISTG